ncbi:tryptophan halogenase family protein [Agaribacter flavus]|uniref:Tryptophan halogenase family protein n=1 Tax=Agaribacter flavus TaxID=1902781 RepID=A0ABV7FK94_9ALTE
MSLAIRSVVIVGGGTAGWISAGVISASLIKRYGKDNPKRPTVTLVESAHTPPIGVGEGTLPTMRATLASMGISESDFIRETHASFKQGSTFRQWRKNTQDDIYQHPFTLPSDFSRTNLAEYWLSENWRRDYGEFAYFATPQAKVCEQMLAPKQSTTPEYAAVCNYGYHLDAAKFAVFLRQHCVEKLSVHHVIDEVLGIKKHDNGHIKAICTHANHEIEGQLFIDCTGAKSLLLGEHCGVEFKSKKDVLFVDSAIATQVNYTESLAPVESNTLSTAQSAGWIWDIGLPTRRGMGYAYASQFTTKENAQSTIEQYIQNDRYAKASGEYRHISFTPGHRARFWQGNCVAIGLSAGFVEPLEASSIALVELSAKMIAEQFPSHTAALVQLERRFNRAFLYRWQRIIDFLKLHYALSQREDSAFWLKNRDQATWPESLKEMLDGWRHQAPWHYDFEQVEIFPSASYQYILCGMGYSHNLQSPRQSGWVNRDFDHLLHSNKKTEASYLAALPTTRELLEKLKRQDFPLRG